MSTKTTIFFIFAICLLVNLCIGDETCSQDHKVICTNLINCGKEYVFLFFFNLENYQC